MQLFLHAKIKAVKSEVIFAKFTDLTTLKRRIVKNRICDSRNNKNDGVPGIWTNVSTKFPKVNCRVFGAKTDEAFAKIEDK